MITKVLNRFLFLSLLLVMGCGGGDDPIDPTPSPSPTITSISISSDLSEVEVGKSIQFSVTGNDGSNLTNQSKILVNGAIISGSSYIPEVKGDFTVSAAYNSILSNSLIIKATPKPVSAVTLLSDNTWVPLNNKFTFTIKDSNNEDITSESTIFVNSFEIEGHTFTPLSNGAYEVYATYKEFKSAVVHLESKQKPSEFIQKVLIEDFTGTWCGWCPRVSYGLEKVADKTDKAVVTAIHRGSSDPYHFGESQIGDLDGGSYPTAKLNRTVVWEYPEPENVNQVLNLTGNKADLGLAIKSSLETTNLQVEVKIAFLKDYENLKFVVYLVEDELLFNQTNYTQYYDAEAVLRNFEHHNVLRKVLTNLFGDSVPTSKNGDEFIKSFELKVPSSVENMKNLKLVAFVVDSSGSVLNVQGAPVDSFNNYN